MKRLFGTVLLGSLLVEIVYTQCSGGCISCDGTICSKCDQSHYLVGTLCNLCPENCVNSKCHDDTGYCVEECEQGKYGRKCQRNCNLCKNGKCDLYKCTDGCKNGYFVYRTDNDYLCFRCPVNCKECVDGRICLICNDGFYLQQLNINNNVNVHCHQCPNGKECSSYCSIEGCNQCQLFNNELVCTNCHEGEIFNGVSCVQSTAMCSQGCSTNCDSDGLCLGYCINGWTGDKCSEKCNDKCLKCSKVDKDICLQCKGDFYSVNCSQPCHQSCMKVEEKQTCRSSDGFCLNGCKQGFWDKNCIQSCSDGCNNSTCERSTGNCTGACKYGYVGGKCVPSTMEGVSTTSSTESSSSDIPNESTQKAKHENESNDIIITGAAAGGGVLVLILIIVVGICLLKRRKKSTDDVPVQNEAITIDDQNLYAKPMKKDPVVQETQDYIYAQPDKSHKRKKHSKKEISQPKNLYDNVAIDLDDEKEVAHGVYSTIALDINDERVAEAETDVDEIELEELDDGNSKLIEREVKPPNADLYYNTESLIRSRIQVSDFLEYSKKKTNYESEFEKLPKGLTRPCDVALMRNNRLKNRYNGVYAYDATRVVLQSKTYINANYIDGHKKSPEYIASLGPTKSAMNDFKDFWEMVWEEKTDKIIVLTNLEESGKMKCEKYWPDQGKTKNYQGYKVFSLAETVYSEFTIRELTVGVKGSEPRKVTQYHYTAWPDRSVPDNVASLIEFRNKVEQTQSRDAGPVVVHCSAGIGRTGAYIALDTLIQEGKADNYVDVCGRVMALRGQRGHMVQNLEQYIFVQQCLLYALTCDVDPLPATDISRTMTEDTISHQFQTFSEVEIPKTFDRKSSANKKVRKENRNGADIPGDQYRVRLCSSKHDYINAVYVNGYKNKKKFIVTQTPLPNTVEDILSVIFHEKCACVVDLDDDNLKDKCLDGFKNNLASFMYDYFQSIGHYLPTDGKSFKVGHFQVTCKKSDTMEHATIRDLTISRNGLSLSDEVHVKHYQYKGWKQTEKVPCRLDTFVKLIKDVEDELNDRKSDKPILVHCLTGAERSCLFCAVSIISEKCLFEKEISVLNTICQLQSRRKTAFSDVSQLQFCYQFVIGYSTNLNRKQYYNMA